MKKLSKLVLPIIGYRNAISYIFLGILTGVCSFSFINLITKVVGFIIDGKLNSVSKDYILLFALVILVYVWGRRQLALTSMDISLQISWTLRKKILRLLIDSNYYKIYGSLTKIQTSILSDINVLTNASLSIIDFTISLFVALSVLIYLSMISVKLFLITLIVTAVGVFIYYFTSKNNVHNLNKNRLIEDEFQRNLNTAIFGLKEIYIDQRKGNYLYNESILKNARESLSFGLKAGTAFINSQMTGQVLFYVLIAMILLVFSFLLSLKASDVVTYVFSLIYLLGSVESLMTNLPGLLKARVAANKIEELTFSMEELLLSQENASSSFPITGSFTTLEVIDLTFNYRNDKKFQIGPIRFSLTRGEIVFIYGGNGSGKTTLINAILGLFPFTNGCIKMNGNIVYPNMDEYYRSNFSVVLNDFFLFDEVLSYETVDTVLWEYYLKLFEIAHKVQMIGNRFSTLQLSTGQRKRLALVIALIEKKPVIVLDEWAADQDPYFREKFYCQILPELSSNGYTIIAITHDEKYYHYCNQLFRMEEGLLYKEKINFI
ncbi:MAG TPA: hypothetical protein DEG63_07420 [Flavobacteriaceae bacterium]|nr:hypothetical protein [Flavobacteriaceae bacterium]